MARTIGGGGGLLSDPGSGSQPGRREKLAKTMKGTKEESEILYKLYGHSHMVGIVHTRVIQLL